MIKKVKEGYKVISEKTGKNLGGSYKKHVISLAPGADP